MQVAYIFVNWTVYATVYYTYGIGYINYQIAEVDFLRTSRLIIYEPINNILCVSG